MKYLLVLATIILAANAALTKKDRKVFLKSHNALRAVHGAGKLKWDKEIAAFAQDWCDGLQAAGPMQLIHSEGSGYGENLFWHSVESGKLANEAVNMWYNEVSSYDFENPGYQSGTGHFTQVVWKASKKLGCGVSQGSSGTYICCNYFPRGNFIGQFAENVSPVSE